MGQSFGTKVVRGSLWTTLGLAGGRGLQFAGDLVLSRLLLPDDFGLMAIALAVVVLTETITDTGFGSAIIQKEGDVVGYLNETWTIEIIKSLILFGLVISLAPFLADYYDDPRATPLISVLALGLIFRGARNPGALLIRKELRMRQQFLIDFLPQLLQMVFVISLAVIYRSVWVLAAGILVRRMAELGLSFMLHPYRPKFGFDLVKLKKLFKFGRWIFLTAALSAIRAQYVVLFIGKAFGLNQLGFFNRAELLSTYIFLLGSRIIWSVGYPAFAMVQNERAYVMRLLSDGIYYLVLFAAPLTTLIYIHGEAIVPWVLSDQWAPSGVLAGQLALVGLVALINTIIAVFLQATGSPQSVVLNQVGGLILLVTGLSLVSSDYGMQGVIWILLFSGILVMLMGIIKIGTISGNTAILLTRILTLTAVLLGLDLWAIQYAATNFPIGATATGTVFITITGMGLYVAAQVLHGKMSKSINHNPVCRILRLL